MNFDIDQKIKEVFQIDNFQTVSQSTNRTRFNLAEGINESEPELRSGKVLDEAAVLFNKYLKGAIAIRLTVWNAEEHYSNEVLKAIEAFEIDRAIHEDRLIVYYHINDFNFNLIENLVWSHINFELGLNPSINATIYFVDFENKVLLNMYDDRGVDVLIR